MIRKKCVHDWRVVDSVSDWCAECGVLREARNIGLLNGANCFKYRVPRAVRKPYPWENKGVNGRRARRNKEKTI